MSSYLSEGETILWKSREGKNYRRAVLIIRAIVSLACIVFLWVVFSKIGFMNIGKYVVLALAVICAIFIAAKQLALYFNLYMVTDNRIIIKRGFLNRKLTSIRFENVTDTKVEQSIWGRMIGTGAVYFLTSNNTHDNDDFAERIPEFRHVDQPFRTLSKITEYMNNPHAYGEENDRRYRSKT